MVKPFVKNGVKTSVAGSCTTDCEANSTECGKKWFNQLTNTLPELEKKELTTINQGSK